MDKAGRKPLILVNFSSNLTRKENNNNNNNTNNLLNSFLFHVFCS